MAATCLTCDDSGEIGTDGGPEPCPDCFGGGSAVTAQARTEWRLARIESGLARLDRDTQADVRWLLHELRRCRSALLQILSRCQDADGDDDLARAAKYAANAALELYPPK